MKALQIFGISLGGLIAIGVIGLMVLGSSMPETSVYLGHQVPKKFLTEIRSLGLLEPNEKIKYLYTDAIFDIKEGMYFVTEDHLVLYCQEWEEPETIISYKDITNIDTEYNESFFEDSYVMIETISGLEVGFPVSSEKERDKEFVRHIKSKMDAKPGISEQPR
jgi:hypothetical protein